MDSAGAFDQERAGCTGRVFCKLLFDAVPCRPLQLLRSEPIDADKFVRIQRDVPLAAADIAAYSARQPFPFFFFSIAYSDRNAGVNDGKGVEQGGQPGDALLIVGEVQTAGQAGGWFLLVFFTNCPSRAGSVPQRCSEQ